MEFPIINLPYDDFMLNEVIDPEEFDINNHTLLDAINNLNSALTNLTSSSADGDSGADHIAITPIALPTSATSDKLQTFLELLVAKLKNDGSNVSGADFIGMGRIAGLAGTTVQEIVHSLKVYADTIKAQANGLQMQVNTSNSNINKLQSDMGTHTHDSRYMTRTELAPYLQGGDTRVHVETFIITNSNNGDGTFSYTTDAGLPLKGALGTSGEQVFDLQKGAYVTGQNHMKAFINDTLYRSQASGGLLEVSNKKVAINPPEGTGTEITIEYFERIGVTGEHGVSVGANPPPPSDGEILWFKVVG